MNINTLLEQKNITKYRLAKQSGVSFTTVSEIANGKTKIKNCTGENLYKLAKALDVAIEDLLVESMEYRQSFEVFKSNICHMVKDIGDIDFIIKTLETNEIRKLYAKKWYPEALYLLAMVDYLSRENNLPICEEYSDIRKTKLSEPLYPASIVTMSFLDKSWGLKSESFACAIPEFKRFNIVENEVRNVV